MTKSKIDSYTKYWIEIRTKGEEDETILKIIDAVAASLKASKIICTIAAVKNDKFVLDLNDSGNQSKVK